MNMKHAEAIAALQRGQDVVGYHEGGNSMVPIIRSHQRVTLTPVTDLLDVEKGDVVFAKVHGRMVLHKVLAVECSRVQIGNNHGLINGWTDKVYGRVSEVHPL